MTITAQVALVGDIPPYDISFLGILPSRTSEEEGVSVRYVYPESPAARAGIAAGDLIVNCQGVKLQDADQLRNMVGTHDRETGDLELSVQQKGELRKLNVKLASLPEEVPPSLPPLAKPDAADAELPATGLIEVKLPEIANNCFAYVPQSYHPDVPHGLLVWLHAPGKFSKDGIEPTWRDVCEKHGLILVAPQAAKDDAWQPTEAEFVRKAIDDVVDRYNVDATRIVAGGDQAGGTFAALVAAANLEVVRGVAMNDAALPARVAIPSSDPLQRLAYFISVAKESKLKDRIESGIERLRENKLPVSRQQLEQDAATLTEKQRAELARWTDTLDRI